jgi:hypothetical protein
VGQQPSHLTRDGLQASNGGNWPWRLVQAVLVESHCVGREQHLTPSEGQNRWFPELPLAECWFLLLEEPHDRGQQRSEDQDQDIPVRISQLRQHRRCVAEQRCDEPLSQGEDGAQDEAAEDSTSDTSG